MKVILPGLKVIESWDENPKKNKHEYLKKARYVALTQYYNGTEFVTYFTEGRKFGWLLKLWAWINGIEKENKK